MKKPIKVVLSLALLLILLIVVGLGVAFWQIDSIAKTAVERGGTYALGVNVAVDSVDVQLFAGDVQLDKLYVDNPDGFDADHLLTAGIINVDSDPSSLRSDTIVIPLIEIETMTVAIEQTGGRKNYQVIIDRLKQLQGPADPDAPPAKRTYRVDKVVIGEIVAVVQVLPIGGSLSTMTVRVPRIELNHVTPDNAQGVALAAVFERITPAIFAAVGNSLAHSGGDIAQLVGNGMLDATGDLGGIAGQLAQQASTQAAKLIQQGVGGIIDSSGNVLKDVGGAAGEGARETIDKIGGGLKDILGGDKKDQPNP